MEMWELFLKGLAKTFEEFALKMIEKGQDKEQHKPDYLNRDRQSPIKPFAERKPPQQSVPSAEDYEKIRKLILDIIGDHPDGITMKNIAKKMDVQWHFLRVPMRELQSEEVILKHDLLYTLPESEPDVSKPVAVKPEVADSKPTPEKAPVVRQSVPEHIDEPKKTVSQQSAMKTELHQPELIEIPPDRSAQSNISQDAEDLKTPSLPPRRRVIDASQLEQKPKTDPALLNLSNRDRERLRYRIMTALRGRPEGLNLVKLSAVLGMDIILITPILNELQAEAKVLSVDNDKFKLP